MFGIVVVITGLADRWILQRYAGSTEQGLFSLSFRIAGICLIFTSAMTQLIMREYAISHSREDHEETRRLFQKHAIMLFTLTSYFSAFICIQSDAVIKLLGGKSFANAGSVMMIMALYPIHQTYGQMNGALLLAIGKTRTYRNVGIAIMLSGLVFTWLLLAPPVDGGMEMGSVGLALKMVALQFIGVNIQLWIILGILKLRFSYYFLHQLGVVIYLLTLSWGASLLVQLVDIGEVGAFILTGSIYSLFTALSFFKWPKIIGLTKEELHAVRGNLHSRFGR